MQRIRNFRQTYHLNWYILLWIIALGIILYLFRNWHIDKQFIGIVERNSHQLGAQEAGKIQTMLGKVGDQVKKGQVLAMLDISDLTTHLDQSRNELTRLQETANARRELYSITAQRILLQLDNEASDLMDRLSMIESKSTELAGLNAEIERLVNAEKAGLGYSRDLSALILQRDALASYLREQSKDLVSQKEKLAKTRRSRQMLESADVDSISKSLLLEQMEYTESLRRDVAATEHRIGMRTILAPCDGYITEIFALPGDIVDAFGPVLVVEELKPRFLDVYIPESSKLHPVTGMQVHIYSSRDRSYNTTGEVTFVHPGFAQASERLSFRGQLFWARKVRVELPADHQLIPGEVVHTRLLKDNNHNSSFSLLSAEAGEHDRTDNEKSPVIKDISIPENLRKRSRIEPSGIAWCSDIKKYLVVSDDTGIQNTIGEHDPVLFAMDDNGALDDDPVRLTGIREVNDLEAIAYAGNNTFYLISSQNISKRGKRPYSRELILRLDADGGEYRITGQIRFLSLLLQSYSKTDLIDLGLDKYDLDGKPVINIEGAAYQAGALFLGLKEPVSKKGAIIWKLDHVDELFQSQRLLQGRLSLYGYVQLDENRSGISDLTFDRSGVLWVLSTIPGASGSEQQGGLHRINRYANSRLEAVQLYKFPGLKPEGLCQQSDETFMIIFDNDNAIPAYCVVSMEGL
ncbi:MAG: biotin/lipoyl-binding protein [candidate division KSB1 bacterium]|jgi:multidrug resistance efflux pump|nr:biotin/lipoyl-binding protein [candidate division KSB1 bacterium]